MTKASILYLFLLLIDPALGFIGPQRPVLVAPCKVVVKTKRTEEIAHELEDLGDGKIQSQVRNELSHESHGFDDYHESVVQKLRHNLRDKVTHYRKVIEDLRKSAKTRKAIDELQESLQRIQQQLEESRTYAVAWETAEIELQNELDHKKQEHDTDRRLLELQESLQNIEQQLVESRAYAIAWETAEIELHNALVEREEEHESIRRLLGQAVKLSFRRLKNGVRRVLPFRQKKEVDS